MIKNFFNVWNTDYYFKTFTLSAISVLIGVAFTIYNGFLGIYYQSIWNGSICVYYILLAVIRGIIVQSQKVWNIDEYRLKKLHLVTHIMMLALNISLIVPIIVMVRGERTYNWGLIPAITIATYTLYQVIMAIMHYLKSKKMNNPLVHQLRTSNLINALVAVLTLQNTMIIANSGEIAGDMKLLSILSSAIIWLIIVYLSIRSFQYF
jgi:hypothetical protein